MSGKLILVLLAFGVVALAYFGLSSGGDNTGASSPDAGAGADGVEPPSPDDTVPAMPAPPTATVAPDTIALVASQAGWSGDDLVTAVAIALAESSGNPVAYNPEAVAKVHGIPTPPGKGSYGLWQVYLFAHPEFEGWNLYDPQINAQAAYQIYNNAAGFNPWSTFGGGQYLAHLNDAAARVGTLSA